MTSGGNRPGSGAPKKPEPEKRVKTSIQIQKWMLDIVDDIATDQRLSRSKAIELILCKHFKNLLITFDNHLEVIDKIKR